MCCNPVSTLCDDCEVDVTKIFEYYVLEDSVWPKDASILCIGCVEKRLDRRLSREDFKPCFGNYVWKQSKRFQERFDQSILTPRELNKFQKDVQNYKLNKPFSQEYLKELACINKELCEVAKQFEIMPGRENDKGNIMIPKLRKQLV